MDRHGNGGKAGRASRIGSDWIGWDGSVAHPDAPQGVGGPGGQGEYLNLVVELDTELSPRQLLGVCHRLESAADRTRDEHWGPRTLDVDLLWHEAGPVDEADLVVPHPRMRERRFVMAPLADLAPDLAGDDWDEHAEGRVARVGEL